MESAHLTKAHEHVRNAATATFSNSIATAGHEHDQAASAFHQAANDTHNAEALRILALLEDHHRKLAGLIKEAPRKKEKKSDSTTPNEAAESSTTSPSPPSKGSTDRTASPSTSSPTRAPSSRRRLPQSSIASNLAEKRGIPGVRRGTPSGTPVSVTNALATRNEQPATPVRDLLERQSRRAEASRPKDPNSPRFDRQDRQDQDSSARQEASPTDDNFRRFYSAFGGVISAISAPLAFTSLPLSPAPPTPIQEPPEPKEEKIKRTRTQSPEASRTVKSSEPDLAALISKPALRALREDGSAPLGPFANNESFYLVPTSGGTVSYANILQNPNAPHPHHAAQNPQLDSIDEGETEGSGNLKGSSHEEFVDARESVGPPSPTTRRPRSQGKSTSPSGITSARTIAAGRGTGLKTMEEIALENETLKNLVDKQAKRIQMWETSSQSSYNALAQSMRARSGGARGSSDPSALAHALAAAGGPLPSPPPTSSNSPPPQVPSSTSEADAKRIADLEALLSTQATRIADLASNNDELAKQNVRNTQVIGRYREQWEKLKAGARKKDQERREKKLAELKAGASSSEPKEKESTSASVAESNAGEAEAEAGTVVAGSEIGDAETEEGFGKA